LAFDELYDLYMNEPGDDQLAEVQDKVAEVRAMADFLNNIVD
jgi:hypothetical protein